MQPQEIRILVVDDEPITRMDLRELLRKSGFLVVGETGDGFGAIELCKRENPDVVLMDIKMPLLDGLSASKVIHEEHLAGTIILLTAYDDREFVEQAQEYGVSGYMVKPVDEKSLIPNIEVAVARSKEREKLLADYKSVSERLENRRVLEQAKGIVMEEQKLTEQAAYDYIRGISREKNISMKRVAEIILMKR